MIIAGLADDGYHTLADLADRYEDLKDVKAHAPTDYNFSTDKCAAYAAGDTAFAAMRLGQVIRAAQQVRKDRLTALTDTANVNVATLASAQARDSLEHAFEARTGRLPNGRFQGTDHYMGRQFKECYRGYIGFFNTKEIVSQLLSPHTLHNVLERRRDNQGNGVTEAMGSHRQ